MLAFVLPQYANILCTEANYSDWFSWERAKVIFFKEWFHLQLMLDYVWLFTPGL